MFCFFITKSEFYEKKSTIMMIIYYGNHNVFYKHTYIVNLNIYGLRPQQRWMFELKIIIFFGLYDDDDHDEYLYHASIHRRRRRRLRRAGFPFSVNLHYPINLIIMMMMMNNENITKKRGWKMMSTNGMSSISFFFHDIHHSYVVECRDDFGHWFKWFVYFFTCNRAT